MPPVSADELSRSEIHELEQLLVRLGFNPGLVDGIADTRTSAAIEGYQEFAALRVDGVASPALLEELRGVAESLGVAVKSAPAEATPPSDAVAGDDASLESGEASEPVAPPPTGQVAGQVTGAPWDAAVHLASFKQEAKAHTEWQRLQQRLPQLFGDMESRVGAFDLGEEGLFFRLYAGPFPNLATAQDFCITVSIEGFRCGVARGEAPQVAATSPATPELTSEPEPPQAQPDSESEAVAESQAAAESEVVAESEAAAEAETAAASEEPPGETAMAADPAVTAPSETPEAAPSLEETPAAEQPDAAEMPEIQEEAALGPGPNDGGEASPSATALAEPAEGSGAAPAAPMALVAAEAVGATASETAPEAGSASATGDVTDDATEDPAEDAPEDPAEALVETGQPGTATAGPTLLIASTQFAQAPADANLGDEGEKPPSGSAIGTPTLLATMFDFGDEEDEPSAPLEPESGSAPSVAAGEAGEPATSEPPEPENGESGAADADSEAGAAAATVPAEAPEPDGTQTAAVPETAVEDYMKATAAFQIGDCTTALRHYEQAFDKGGLPHEALASAHNNRGRCLYSLGQFDDALADFDRAIDLDQDFAAAYYNRGRVHTAMGRSAEARADLKSAYDLGFGRLQAQE